MDIAYIRLNWPMGPFSENTITDLEIECFDNFDKHKEAKFF